MHWLTEGKCDASKKNKDSDVQISLLIVFLADQRKLDHISQQFSWQLLWKKDAESGWWGMQKSWHSPMGTAPVCVPQEPCQHPAHRKDTAIRGSCTSPGPCRGHTYIQLPGFESLRLLLVLWHCWVQIETWPEENWLRSGFGNSNAIVARKVT